MCEECHNTFCPSTCPFQKEDLRHASCELCGEILLPGDGGYTRAGRHVCLSCAAEMSLDDLLTLGDLSGVGELLSLIGFSASA